MKRESTRSRGSRLASRPAVLVAAGRALAGAVVAWQSLGRGLSDGPLEGGSGVWVAVPLDEEAQGLAWGNQEFQNYTSEPIVLVSITLLDGGGDPVPSAEPYIWGPGREKTTGSGGLVSAFLPLPQEWRDLERHRVEGYVIAPAPEDPPPDGPAYTDAELLVEFAVPDGVASVLGVEVTYETGGRRYTERFQNTITVCPPQHTGECVAEGAPE